MFLSLLLCLQGQKPILPVSVNDSAAETRSAEKVCLRHDAYPAPVYDVEEGGGDGGENKKPDDLRYNLPSTECRKVVTTNHVPFQKDFTVM